MEEAPSVWWPCIAVGLVAMCCCCVLECSTSLRAIGNVFSMLRFLVGASIALLLVVVAFLVAGATEQQRDGMLLAMPTTLTLLVVPLPACWATGFACFQMCLVSQGAKTKALVRQQRRNGGSAEKAEKEAGTKKRKIDWSKMFGRLISASNVNMSHFCSFWFDARPVFVDFSQIVVDT